MNVKLAVGGGFLVGAIFWAGATYNRMGNMEAALSEIKTSISALNEVPVLKLKVSDLERQVQALQDEKWERLANPGGQRR